MTNSRDLPDIESALLAVKAKRMAGRLGGRCTASNGDGLKAYAEQTPSGTVWGVNVPGHGFNLDKTTKSK
jgi:hypothetical protein